MEKRIKDNVKEWKCDKSGKRMPKWYAEKWGKGGERSKTFPGIARAMAEQWSEIILKTKEDGK